MPMKGNFSRKETPVMTQPDSPTPPPQSQGSTPPPVNYSAPAGAVYSGPEPTADAKQLSMITHILNFIFLVPLLVYLLKKDDHPFLADQSREALNFTLTCLIGHVICWATSFLCIPVLIAFALTVVQIVFGIIGGLKARDGIPYRYPVNIRFIK
jgi:uncharacterized Tic20 family protein